MCVLLSVNSVTNLGDWSLVSELSELPNATKICKTCLFMYCKKGKKLERGESVRLYYMCYCTILLACSVCSCSLLTKTSQEVPVVACL